jgi:hypothetical protein
VSVVQLDFYDREDLNGTPLLSIDDEDVFLEGFEMRVSLRDLGSGLITLSRQGVSADDNPSFLFDVARAESFVRVLVPAISTDYLFGFFLDNRKTQVLSPEESAGMNIIIGGSGPLYYLSRAILWNEKFSGTAATVDEETGLWTFPDNSNWNAGKVFETLLAEDAANTLATFLPDLTLGFDDSLDSNGDAWTDLFDGGLELEIGTHYLQALRIMQEQADDLDATMHLGAPGAPLMRLDMYNRLGRDLTGSTMGAGVVLFKAGINSDPLSGNILTGIEASGQSTLKPSHVLVRGADGVYSQVDRSLWSAGDFTKAVAVDYQETSGETSLFRYGRRIMADWDLREDAQQLEIHPGFDEANGLYMPGPDGSDGHFWIGDDITLKTGGDAVHSVLDYHYTTERVTGIRMVLDEAVDGSTDAKAALSWHIVPELNEVFGLPGGDLNRGVASRHQHPMNPQLCPPGTAPTDEVVTPEEHWDWDAGAETIANPATAEDEPFLNSNLNASTSSGDQPPWGSGYIRPGTGTNSFQWDVTAGTLYRARLEWARFLSPSVRWRLRWRDSGGTTLSHSTLFSGNPSANVAIVSTGDFTAPVGAVDVELVKDRPSDGSGVAAYLGEFTFSTVTPGSGGGGGDGHPDLVGTATRAARCDHRHDVHRGRAPTVDDDYDNAGYKLGTIWAQLDDLENPTQIVAVYMAVDVSDGAAVWLEITSSTVPDHDHESVPTAVQALAHGQFLMASHQGSDTAIYLLTSDDGISWGELNETAIIDYGTGSTRDPSIMHWDGQWWIAHTGKDGDDSDDAWSLWSSDDLVTWTKVGQPSTSSISGVFRTWAPEWFVDPADQSVHVFVACSITDATAFKIYEMHPTNRGMTTWSDPVEVTGTGFVATVIDPFMVYAPDIGTAGKPYKLFWKSDVSGDTNRWIGYSESDSLTSGFAAVETGDWAGWKDTDSIEAPCVVKIDDGRWRAYFNENDGFGSVGVYYSESTDDWATWSARAEITTPSLMAHGTILRIRGMLDHERDPHAHPGLVQDSLTVADVRDIGHWEVLMEGSAGTLEPITNEAEDDWLYGWFED